MSVSPSTIAAIRFGTGLAPGVTPPDSKAGLLAEARAGAATPLLIPLRMTLAERTDAWQAAQKLRKAAPGDKDQAEPGRVLLRMAGDEAYERILQRALSPHGFFERLSAFWADHFTVAIKSGADRVFLPTFEPDAIRPHVMGRFDQMLVAVVQNPLMLRYLDQVESFGPDSPLGRKTGRGLNENFAREVLELHTLGVGAPYTQDDVRQFAELLTGYMIGDGGTRFKFEPRRAEPGAETVLGRSYGGGEPAQSDVEAALRDLALHPATAQHLARKLAVHFVADEPDPDLVAAIARAWADSGGDLPTVYAALLDHPAAWAPLGGKIKQPLDLAASTLRATGIDPRGLEEREAKIVRRLFGDLRDLNQPIFAPGGPNGWPEAAEFWLSPQGLAARLAFASATGQWLARRRDLDPRDFARAALGDALRPDTAFVVGAAPDRWEGFALTLASPEFNRR